MDGQQQIRTLRHISNIVDRPVDKQVVVCNTALQDGLAARDVLIQSVDMGPETVGWCKIDRSVKQPAGPSGFGRRISCSMVKNMVHTCQECLFHFRFTLSKRY